MSILLHEKNRMAAARLNWDANKEWYETKSKLNELIGSTTICQFKKYKTYGNGQIDYYYVLVLDHHTLKQHVYDVSLGQFNEIFAKYENLSEKLIEKKFSL